MRKRSRCSQRGFCSGMLHVLSDVGDKRGFNTVTLLNIKTGKSRNGGVRYCRTGRVKDRGIMLNYCPFCGADIQWFDRKAAGMKG